MVARWSCVLVLVTLCSHPAHAQGLVDRFDGPSLEPGWLLSGQYASDAYATAAPGLRVALPATPHDAKGLLKTAIRSDDPVIFLEHKKLYNTKGEVPEEEYLIPFGQARQVTTGRDVTLVAAGYMVALAGEPWT